MLTLVYLIMVTNYDNKYYLYNLMVNNLYNITDIIR